MTAKPAFFYHHPTFHGATRDIKGSYERLCQRFFGSLFTKPKD
jgi:hypothetical protein